MAYIEPDFKKYAVNGLSRFGEGALVKHLTNTIELTSKFTSKSPFLVEIGIHPDEGNTLELIQESDWDGLWIDVRPREVPNDDIKRFPIHGHWIRTSNINPIFSEYNVPWDFDVFSIDIDGNDYWIWDTLLYQPRIVVIEYNPHLLIDESKVVPYKDAWNWRGDRYYGASLKALHKLGIKKGYTLIGAYCHNAFFIRNDCIDNPEDFKYEEIYEYFPCHPFETNASIHKGSQQWVEV